MFSVIKYNPIRWFPEACIAHISPNFLHPAPVWFISWFWQKMFSLGTATAEASELSLYSCRPLKRRLASRPAAKNLKFLVQTLCTTLQPFFQGCATLYTSIRKAYSYILCHDGANLNTSTPKTSTPGYKNISWKFLFCTAQQQSVASRCFAAQHRPYASGRICSRFAK